MRDKKNAPEIRFKGFLEPWEEKNLNKIGETYSGLTGKTKEDFGHGNARFITYMNVYANPIADINGVESIEIDNTQHVVEKGDIFFTTSSETPDEVAMSSVWLGNFNNIYLNSFCFGFHPKETIDSFYIAYLLRSMSFRNKVIPLAQGISRYNVSKNKVMDIKISIPPIKEQQKIGKFFSKIDDLIKFQQQKIDKLQNVKKSMLDKMFPKNGNTIPEIRFKGFSEPWEYHKLNHYLQTSTDKNLDELYDKSDVLSVSGEFGIVNQIEFQGRSFAGVSVANYGIVKVGDVVYTKSPLNSNPYGIIKTNKIKTGIVSTLYAVYHPQSNVFSDFIQVYYEQNARVNNYLHPLVNKGAKNDMKISDDNALKGIVIFPDYKEQKCIANFFDAIDILINLYHCKLKKLKKIKKSMLDKMFV